MRTAIPLDVIDIATPCPIDWNDMRGDERVRFCKHCSLHVYNLSEMSRPDAEDLVAETEGRLCVRFYRRADGTVLTRDCGWRVNLKRAGKFAAAAVAVVLCAALTPFGFGDAVQSIKTFTEKDCQPQPAKMGEVHEVVGDVMVGAIAVVGKIGPPPATQPTTAPATHPARDGS